MGAPQVLDEGSEEPLGMFETHRLAINQYSGTLKNAPSGTLIFQFVLLPTGSKIFLAEEAKINNALHDNPRV